MKHAVANRSGIWLVAGSCLGLAELLVPACAHVAAPVDRGRSPAGLDVAVTERSCTQVEEADWYGEDLAEMTVDVEVRNPTAAALSFQRDAMKLHVPSGGRLASVSWRADEPLTVAPGETKDFELRFVSRGLMTCAETPRLDGHGGLVIAAASPAAASPAAASPAAAPRSATP
jgi:hypothetical protein